MKNHHVLVFGLFLITGLFEASLISLFNNFSKAVSEILNTTYKDE